MSEAVYTQAMTTVAMVFEAIAAAVLLIGLLFFSVSSLRQWARTRSGQSAYRLMRQGFGGVLLLSLEILVAGDLIRTVAVAPTLDNVIVLGIIVLIRTFLSFSLEIEIDGVPPWRKALVSGASVATNAQRKANSEPSAS
ncbi:MAG: DUF1622 domain-containing protein [Actinomycetota bacterium]